MAKFTTPANTSTEDAKKRAEELGLNREMYNFDHTYLPPIAVLKLHVEEGNFKSGAESAAVEPDEPASGAEIMLPPELHELVRKAANEGAEEAEVLTRVAPLAGSVGKALGEVEYVFKKKGPEYDKATGVPKQEVPPLVSYLLPRGINNAVSESNRKRLIKSPPPLQKTADYQAYLAPFSAIDKFNGFSSITTTWNDDVVFGWQRLAGVNPRVLTALTPARRAALAAKIDLSKIDLTAVAGATATVDSGMEQGRLYYCDYGLLDGLPLQDGRLMYPCIGVFWSNVAGKQLLPVGIQLSQKPGRVYVPKDPDWELARLHFQVADFNYHEMGTHLSEAHFAQEAFVVAARRNFPQTHPIGAFLYQIYFALLYNNTLGRQQLVNKGGFVEKMMAGKLEEGSLAIVRNFYRDVWTWDDWNLESYLTRQGTTNTAALPVYPYRDDGLPLFKAIQTFLTAYVAAWYDGDADVVADDCIKGFVADLVDPNLGKLDGKGFPKSITTRTELSEVLARLTWQASGGHGGINYSQYQYFAWMPNAPGAAYADTGPLMGALPPSTATAYQQNILNVLTYKIFGTLGTYDESFMRGLNNDAKGAVASFQAALKALTADVAQRNTTFPRVSLKYPWLDPAQLPNSTNI